MRRTLNTALRGLRFHLAALRGHAFLVSAPAWGKVHRATSRRDALEWMACYGRAEAVIMYRAHRAGNAGAAVAWRFGQVA